MKLAARATLAATAQVDALAAPPPAESGARVDARAQLLAVAQSHLEGNEWGGVVALEDPTGGERRAAFSLASGVAALAWANGGDLLALACDNGDVQLLRAAWLEDDLALVPAGGGPESAGHDDVATSASVSPLVRSTLATGSWDLTVKVWDVASMDKPVATLEGHTDLVWGVAMNPQAAHVLASAAQDCTVQLWDTRQPTDAVAALAMRFPALALDWRPQHETIISVGLEDGSVLTFDTRSPGAALLETKPHAGPVHALKYSPFHADVLASGGDDGCVFLRENGVTGDFSSSNSSTNPHSDYVRALEWLQAPSSSTDSTSSFSTLLATGSWDKTVRTWSVDE